MSRHQDDYSAGSLARVGARYSALAIVVAALAIVVALAIGVMALFGFGLFNRSTADYRGRNSQIEQTKGDGTYRIAAYERFYGLCASVQDDEASVESLEEELKTDPPADRVVQVNASLTALRSSRAEKINRYNADARKSATLAQFKASDLPHELDKTAEETTCAACSRSSPAS